MKITFSVVFAAMLFVTFNGLAVSNSKVDLTGTWVGKTFIANQGDDEISLTVKRDGDVYSALLNDAFGILQNVESTVFDYKDGKLVIKISVPGAYGTTDVTITLSVAENTMTGAWQTQEGETGEITLTREQ